MLLPLDAVAISVIQADSVKVLPLPGAVKLTLGAAAVAVAGAGGVAPCALTITLTAADCVVTFALSVATAMSEYLPAVTLLQVMLYGEVVSVPISVDPA